MRIVVAYKWAPNPQGAVVGAGGVVDWSRAEPDLSEYDPVAFELARCLADGTGGEVIGLTAGTRRVSVSVARQAALARGLDRCVIVADDALDGAGTTELAAVLAAAVRRIGEVDLVITGDSSVDVGAKLVPAVLAGQLGWPALGEVTAVTGGAGLLRVERILDGGTQVIEITGPAVLAASTDAAAPRLLSMRDIQAAGKKPAEILELADCDLPASGATVTVTATSRPDLKARRGSSSIPPTPRRPPPSSSPPCTAPACSERPHDGREAKTMSLDTWIVVAGDPAIGDLIETARSLGGQVTAVVAGPRAVAETVAAGGVDKVVWLGEPGSAPVEAYATAAADAIEAAPGVMLGATRPSDRVLLGAVAARLQAPCLIAPSALSAEGDSLVVTHSTSGGIAEETVVVAGPLAVTLDGGPVPVANATSGKAPVEEAAAVPLQMTVVETRDPVFEQVDLGAARRVVSVGRGLKAQVDIAMIEAFAKASHSEIACSRPLATGLGWLNRDRYVGISGQRVAPAVYFAIGISGQLQHMIGVRGATTIVAINSDPYAPVFEGADYCLVGDLYKIVPALTAALN